MPGNPKFDPFHWVKIVPKLEKLTDCGHKLIISEDGQDTSACKISGHSLHAFSGKCPETSPDGRTDGRSTGRTDGRTCRKMVTVGRVESLAFVRRIHRWTVNSPHKGPVTRKMLPFDNVIITIHLEIWNRRLKIWSKVRSPNTTHVTLNCYIINTINIYNNIICWVKSLF